MSEEEIIKKFGLDIKKLEAEQNKLAGELELKDAEDFKNCSVFAAVETVILGNRLAAGVILCDKNFEIIEEQFFVDKIHFPFLKEFRAYRELPVIMGAFDKLQASPEIVFIRGQGVSHPRLGIASHFSLSANVPAIGVADFLFDCDKIDEGFIIKNSKKVGRVLQSKENSNPIYVSPGNKITVNSSYELTKRLIKAPHKMPEPLHLAHKYVREIQREIGINNLN